MSMARPSPDFSGGYEIVEAPGFLERVEAEIGDVQRWDEMRRGLDLWISRDPTGLPVCRHISDNQWFARIKSDPLVYLLYQVDDFEQVVTYLNVRVLRDPIEDLDPEFDDLR